MSESDTSSASAPGIGPVAAAGIIASLFQEDPPPIDLPKIPGFRIVELLGRGGGGAVYLAFKPGSESRLAIKILAKTGSAVPMRCGSPSPSQLSPPQAEPSTSSVTATTELTAVPSSSPDPSSASRRAWRELDLLQQLRLPALPRLIEYGFHAGKMYIATEFVDGLPLDRYCDQATQAGERSEADVQRRRDIDRRARVKLLADVADAVHSLHERGVIHRDIKPSNILIDPNGLPVIIDLGIATLLAHDVLETLTTDGAPIGSPAFMAPEQARGERDQISTRADVYGLGATAYLLLTGATPYDTSATIHEVVRRVAQDPPRSARELEPSLPKPLAAVLEKAVSPRPEDRYASAAGFAADLRRWLNAEVVTAVGAGVWTKLVRWVGRHPVAASATLTAFFVLLSVATISVSLLYHLWYDKLPFNFVPIVDHSTGQRIGAQLESRSGRALERFGGPGCVLRIAQVVQVPGELGGGDVAVLCIQDADQGSTARTTDSQLWVCRPSDFQRPIWKTEPTGPIVPPYPEPYTENYKRDQLQFLFSVEAITIADVFSESPGPEIVTSLRSKEGTPHAIRIYSLMGESGKPQVLFECWHFGPVFQLVWWPEKRLLLGWGDRHGRLTHSWSALLNDNRFDKRYTHTVFAIEPVFGGRDGWLNGSLSDKPSPLLKWYKSLGPVEPQRSFVPRLIRDNDGFGINGIHVCFVDEMHIGATDGPSWYIDAEGNRIKGTAHAGDHWRNQFFAGDSAAAKEFVEKNYDLREFPGWFEVHQKRTQPQRFPMDGGAQR